MKIRSSIAAALILAGAFLPTSTVEATAQSSGCQLFRETGKEVCGAFLSYWSANGGLERQGYPISAEFNEVSDVDGKSYTVQYFERAVFEHHPDNALEHRVLLSLLGSQLYKQNYPQGAPGQRPDNSSGSILFRETGMRLGGTFLDYWQANGGLRQFGYPISNPFRERSQLDGKEYTVQYFERAVFEMHPENDPPYDVLLSQLGTFQYKAKYARTLATGAWGGDQVAMFVGGEGTRVEFPCAYGDIQGPVRVDDTGRFEVEGTYTTELPAGETGQSQPARFSGLTDGQTTTLTVTLTDTGRRLGTYVLVLGKTPFLVKCQ